MFLFPWLGLLIQEILRYQPSSAKKVTQNLFEQSETFKYGCFCVYKYTAWYSHALPHIECKFSPALPHKLVLS